MAQADALPLPQRRKAARTFGFEALQLEKAGALTDVAALDVALEALTRCAMVHGWPQTYHMARARLMLKRRDMLGLPEPLIAAEKAMTLDVEIGGVLVADSEAGAFDMNADGPFHKVMERQGFYFVGFGGDGIVKVRLRVHKSGPVEPQSKEFRRLREATQVGVLEAPSGTVTVHGGGQKILRLPVPPGTYACCAYGLGIGRKPECLMLLSPLTDRPAPLTDTPALNF